MLIVYDNNSNTVCEAVDTHTCTYSLSTTSARRPTGVRRCHARVHQAERHELCQLCFECSTYSGVGLKLKYITGLLSGNLSGNSSQIFFKKEIKIFHSSRSMLLIWLLLR